MSDKATERQVTSSEILETPNQESSQEKSSSSPGNSDVELDSLIEKLASHPRLVEAVTAISQSDKDKGIASAKKAASEALESTKSLRETVARLDEYINRYGDKETAIREMERDDKIEQILSGTPATQVDRQSAGPDNRPWAVRQKEILDSVGLSLSDPRVIELAKSKNAWDHDEWIRELAEKSFGWVQTDLTKPQPDISTVANPTRSAGTSGSSMSGSSEELGNRMVELQKNYSKNKEEIHAIEQELIRREKEGK